MVNEELGQYIEKKMQEKEAYLRQQGKIKEKRKLSRNYMAEVLGVSKAWFSSIVNGENEPSDELLLKIANYLEVDEHEIFKVARRIHPDVLEKYKREYLGEYYIESTKKMCTK